MSESNPNPTEPPNGPQAQWGQQWGQTPAGAQPEGQQGAAPGGQGWGPTPSQPPYGPPPPDKRRRAGKGCLFGCLGVVVLFALIGIIAAAVSGGGTSSPSSSTPTPEHSSTTQHAAGAASASAASPTPNGSKVVLSISGSGTQNTAKFTVGNDWEIRYTFNCSNSGLETGNFVVYVDYPNGDVPVNELKSKGSGTSHEYDAGDHWLKINSECNWTVKVIDNS